jgi:rod shape-determining protein MreC
VALPRRTGRSRLTLALLILTSIAVLTLDFRDAAIVQSARRVVATIFSPLEGVGRTATSPFRNGWNGITKYSDIKDENERLRDRVAELEAREVRNANALQEYEQLLAENQIPWVGDVATTSARVVQGPTSNFSHSVQIDKGSKAGIRVGMPVVSAAGLVGRVQQVTSSRAVIQLLTDPDFRVGVKLLPDGILGTAKGGGEGDPLVVDTGIDPDKQKIEPGGSITTSGAEGSRFPAAIPVGTVRGTQDAGGGLTLDLLVEPAVDTQRLQFVTVLLTEGSS